VATITDNPLNTGWRNGTVLDLPDIVATEAFDASLFDYRKYLTKREEHPAFLETANKLTGLVDSIWNRDIEDFDFRPVLRWGCRQQTFREFLKEGLNEKGWYNQWGELVNRNRQTMWKSSLGSYAEYP
jgi:hypothetical protein